MDTTPACPTLEERLAILCSGLEAAMADEVARTVRGIDLARLPTFVHAP